MEQFNKITQMRILFLVLIFSFSWISCKRRSNHRIVAIKNQTIQDQRNDELQSAYNGNRKQNRTIMSGQRIFAKYSSAVFMVFTSDGKSSFQGSGFFINSRGLAVSNYHVFKGTTVGAEYIHLSDDRVLKVKSVIDCSEEMDYILFQVDIGNQSVDFLPVRSMLPQTGERVYAIGSPMGLENTFSSGEVSQIRGKSLIQISVPIDQGSSGGALINVYGEAIGITTSGIGESGANLNFAISMNVLSEYID